MDVTRTIRVFMITLIMGLSACKQSETASEATFPAPADTCAGTTVENRFIVHWKNGAISVEKADDRATFVRTILNPLRDDIRFAEHDQIIRQQEPAQDVMDEQAPDPAEVHWGQERTLASSAWQKGATGAGVIVAVIDSGVDTQHPQLAGRMAINTNEILNGIDDDANGLIDDLIGYDFQRKTGDVQDTTGHGTHVAGVIAADPDAGEIHGMAPKSHILPLDFMNESGAGMVSDAIMAIQYAVSRGARVINASWGGAPCSQLLETTIKELEHQGVLFVTAAGNSGLNIDYAPEFPAAFNLAAQLTVGASTRRDFQAGFSNYGDLRVHLLAPGDAIWSTVPGGIERLRGTSMAAPFVSGAAALLWSHRPQASVHQIKTALKASVDPGPHQVETRGRLNVERAISEIERLVP